MGQGKGKQKDKGCASDADFITVQRLSAEVSGKAQKYSRVGARVFVPYEFDEFTIQHIKTACLKHFAVDQSMTCDVVAGEQGPSCRSFKQIPDSKVIHVRFVKRTNIEVDECFGPDQKSPPAKKRCSTWKSGADHKSQPQTHAASPSKFVPRSLSVVDMLQLGKTIDQKTTKVDIYSFNLEDMSSSSTPHTIDFSIQKEPFGCGGFRKAFVATSSAAEFCGTKWVVKRYLDKSIEDITTTRQTVEQHTKVVQMHYLSRNFAARLDQEATKK